MSALTPSMDAFLAQDRALVTLLIEAQLPGYNLRLAAGSGVLPWNDKAFLGEDPVFGAIAGVDEIEDGDSDEAPAFGFSMHPSSAATAAQLCSPTYQRAPVSVWLAGIDRPTGLLIADPYLLFAGFVDQPTLRVGRGQREVSFQCVSQFDLLLEEDEGARLSDAFHQSVHPGETGFANVTGVEKAIYWGVATPNMGAVNVGAYAGTNPNKFSGTDYG